MTSDLGKIRADMSKITALQAARFLIETGEERFICVALNRFISRTGREELCSGAEHMKVFIMRQLAPFDTLETWTAQDINGEYGDFGSDLRLHFRAIRLQWIDHMIGQLDGTIE